MPFHPMPVVGARSDIVRLTELMPHEEVDAERVREVVLRMDERGVQKYPIITVRVNGNDLIADGHHRVAAHEELGLRTILATRLSQSLYLDPERITIRGWRSEDSFDPRELIRRAQAGELFPNGTTKHFAKVREKGWETFHHHRVLSPEVNLSLMELSRR